MSRKKKLTLVILLALSFLIFLGNFVLTHDIAVFAPEGVVGQKEKSLIITAILLSLIVVIPVYIMLIAFSLKYREGNKKSKYDPNLDGSRLFETIWWGVPLTIITILAVITFKSSHELDPFKKLDSAVPPLKIQVISLQWKWLFIYPNENLATVNFVQFPVNTPVDFEITSDSPMNSFWIPRLGGQIYAMNGMATHLNLNATSLGDYYGMSANISGAGFAGMHFTARASSESAYREWVRNADSKEKVLDINSYNELAKPSQDNPVSYYYLAEPNLFSSIINKYEAPLRLGQSEAAR